MLVTPVVSSKFTFFWSRAVMMLFLFGNLWGMQQSRSQYSAVSANICSQHTVVPIPNLHVLLHARTRVKHGTNPASPLPALFCFFQRQLVPRGRRRAGGVVLHGHWQHLLHPPPQGGRGSGRPLRCRRERRVLRPHAGPDGAPARNRVSYM